jgi:6-pyruvoyltetrahydropterin/6-carboxytetrahydropterin synthase
MYIRVTKEFSFEMAHALLNHDGPCRNIHGHSYHLSVTLIGKPLQDDSSPKEGMVVDFSDLKKIVLEKVVNPFDHALMLRKSVGASFRTELNGHKLLLVEFTPTCENLLIYIAGILKDALPAETKLHHLMLRETNTSFAEWYAQDN